MTSAQGVVLKRPLFEFMIECHHQNLSARVGASLSIFIYPVPFLLLRHMLSSRSCLFSVLLFFLAVTTDQKPPLDFFIVLINNS